jgi:hypothetical protein
MFYSQQGFNRIRFLILSNCVDYFWRTYGERKAEADRRQRKGIDLPVADKRTSSSSAKSARLPIARKARIQIEAIDAFEVFAE